MRNPRETWDMMSSYLGRKKEIPHKKIDKRKIQLVNRIINMMKTRQQIPEIILMVILRSYKMTRS